MRILVVLCLVVAFAIAGATWLIVPSLMRQPAAAAVEAPKPAPAARVLVAAQNLPAGTIVKSEHVRWQDWPESGVAEGYIVEGRPRADEERRLGRGPSRHHRRRADHPQRLVQKGEAGFLAAALSPGMRAVSVKIDAVSGTSGFILPGDNVDVMLTSQYEMDGRGGEGKRETKSYAEIVLSNVRVLAIDQNMNDVVDENTPAKVGATATLEVTLRQAQIIGVAGQLGRLTLVLAGLEERQEPTPSTGHGYVEELEVSRFLKAVKQGGSETAETGEGGKSVSVWRGTKLSSVEPR